VRGKDERRDKGSLLTVLTLVVVLLVATGAYADGPTGGGYIDTDGIGADVGTSDDPVPGVDDGAGNDRGAGTGGESAGEANPFQWQRQWVAGYECRIYANGTTGINNIGAPALPPEAPAVTETGSPYEDVLVDTRTGEVVAGGEGSPDCSFPSQPIPPLPPEPPSTGEVRDRTPLPAPAWGVSPQADGLTGLETWLWDDNGDAGRDVTATIRGYAVTTHAEPESWRWTMAEPGEPGPPSRTNPNPVVAASQPGTPSDPAASYTYETAGDYTLTLRVTWRGTYTFSGNGAPPVTVDLGTIVRESSRDYHVAQLRPVLEGLASQ
jgi:hypothetical protein